MAEIRTRTPYGLTEKGFNLLTKVLAGKAELEITRVAIGDGYLIEGQSELTVTDLVHEIPSHVTGAAGTGPTVDIARIYDAVDDDGNPVCMMNVIVQNGDNEETKIREFIAYANDPDEGQIAYGYTNLGDSAYPFPKYSGKEHVSYDWNFSTYISSAANVTANVTLVAGVTHEEFYNHLNNIDNPHTIEFTEAEELTNIESGEKLSVIFGKIKKAIATLISKMPNWDSAYTHSTSAHAPSNANYYTHPSSHSASMITETTSKQFVTAEQKEQIHSHDNKSVLDGITSGSIDKWDAATAIINAICPRPSMPYFSDSEEGTLRFPEDTNLVGRTFYIDAVGEWFDSIHDVQGSKIYSLAKPDGTGRAIMTPTDIIVLFSDDTRAGADGTAYVLYEKAVEV